MPAKIKFHIPEPEAYFNSKPGEDIDNDELEILQACEKYRREWHLPHCEITQIIGLMRKLGWRKVSKLGVKQ